MYSDHRHGVVVSVVKLGSNIASLSAQRRLAEGPDLLTRTVERLASGQRIHRASDDAAGLSIADSLRADSRVFAQGVRNLNDGISLLNIADGAIEQLSQITIRLVELAEQAANGTYSHVQRKALDQEAQALSKEFFRISRSTKFNGLSLFDGSVSEVRLKAGYGSDGGIMYGLGGALGTGTFASNVSYSAGSAPSSIDFGDFDRDGVLDLVTVDYGSGTFSVFLGQGDGTFAPRVSYSTGDYSRSLTVGDFNGDGILDLVSANSIDSSISILLGQGDGTFANQVSFSAGIGSSPYAVKAGDFNGDGILDLVTADYTSNSVSIYIGQGDGTFAPRVSYSTGSTPSSVTVGDFNGDGVLDLVSTDLLSNTISVFIGQGDGTFAPRVSYSTGNSPVSVTAGDFNGDGVLDLVTTDRGANTISVFIGQGDGTFAPRVSYSTGSSPRSVSAGDFNGDGVLDLVTTDRFSNTVSVFIGRGDGSFAPRVSYSTGSGPSSVTAGDFNGDGVLDLVSANYSSSNTSILLGLSKDGIAPLLPFSLKTMADASQALPMLERKRDQLATQRGQIGAFQARVTVATNTLTSVRENFLAAESRIRDADIAQESANLIRLNILQQAAAAVLSQANQQPQIAIKLLES